MRTHCLIIRLWAVVCLVWLAPAAAVENDTLVLIRLEAVEDGKKMPMLKYLGMPVTIKPHGASEYGRPYYLSDESLKSSDIKSGWATVRLKPGRYNMNYAYGSIEKSARQTYSFWVLSQDMPVLYLGSVLAKCEKKSIRHRVCGNFEFSDESNLAEVVAGRAVQTELPRDIDFNPDGAFGSVFESLRSNGLYVVVVVDDTARLAAVYGGFNREFSKLSMFGMATALIGLSPVLMVTGFPADKILKAGADPEKNKLAQPCMDALEAKSLLTEAPHSAFSMSEVTPSAGAAELSILPLKLTLRECSKGLFCLESEIKFVLRDRRQGTVIYERTLKSSADPKQFSSNIYTDLLGGGGTHVPMETWCSAEGPELLKQEYSQVLSVMAEVVHGDLQSISLAPK